MWKRKYSLRSRSLSLSERILSISTSTFPTGQLLYTLFDCLHPFSFRFFINFSIFSTYSHLSKVAREKAYNSFVIETSTSDNTFSSGKEKTFLVKEYHICLIVFVLLLLYYCNICTRYSFSFLLSTLTVILPNDRSKLLTLATVRMYESESRFSLDGYLVCLGETLFLSPLDSILRTSIFSLSHQTISDKACNSSSLHINIPANSDTSHSSIHLMWM